MQRERYPLPQLIRTRQGAVHELNVKRIKRVVVSHTSCVARARLIDRIKCRQRIIRRQWRVHGIVDELRRRAELLVQITLNANLSQMIEAIEWIGFFRPPGSLLKKTYPIRSRDGGLSPCLRLILGQRYWRCRARRASGRRIRRRIVRGTTADLADRHANAIARHAVKAQTYQHVAQIAGH